MLRQLLTRRPPGSPIPAAPAAPFAGPAPVASAPDEPDGPAPTALANRPRASWRDDLIGGHHMLAYLRDLVRGNTVPKTHFPERLDPDQPPVLLLHGFMGTRGSMIMLERRMVADGLTVFTFNLGLINTHDIRTSAILLQRKVEAILAQVHVDKVDIVGHSMGGLIGLYYLKRLGGAPKVRRMVMMGTPIRGTWSALLGVATIGLVSASSWQILPSSRFLADLRRGPLPEGVRYYTIAAERDWVCPPSATVLPGAEAMTVPLGHSSLVMSDEVYACVRRAILS